MFFVIPEMPSKTFVMLYKKLPDHFNMNEDIYMQLLGQPDNNKGIENCGHFWNAINYKWNDAPCNFHYHFLCQTDRC